MFYACYVVGMYSSSSGQQCYPALYHPTTQGNHPSSIHGYSLQRPWPVMASPYALRDLQTSLANHNFLHQHPHLHPYLQHLSLPPYSINCLPASCSIPGCNSQQGFQPLPDHVLMNMQMKQSHVTLPPPPPAHCSSVSQIVQPRPMLPACVQSMNQCKSASTTRLPSQNFLEEPSPSARFQRDQRMLAQQSPPPSCSSHPPDLTALPSSISPEFKQAQLVALNIPSNPRTSKTMSALAEQSLGYSTAV